MNDTTAQTLLFTSPTPASPGEDVSARAAYQFALYARAALVDARRDPVVAIHPDLSPRPPAEAAAGSPARLFVVADDDDQAATVVAQLRRVVGGTVAGVRGGFQAWLDAGLPVVRSA